jgi:hypothetical protein
MADDFLHYGLLQDLQRVENRAPRRLRQRGDPLHELFDGQFINIFRLSKPLVRELIKLVRPHLPEHPRVTDISIETKVLVALRFFAAGSYQLDVGLSYHFKISQASVSRCINEIVNAVNRPEVFNTYVKFPSTLEELTTIRTAFQRQHNFPGVIGCIDCTHVAIFPPYNNPDNPEYVYVNRKNYHSLNVQLICDDKLKITNVNASFPGSTHDSFIWNQSNVQRVLRRLHLTGETNYFLSGDSCYPLRTWLLIPVEGDFQPGTPEYRYNVRHRSTRSTIERCNGVLKARFRCLLKHRVLHYNPQVAGRIIKNLCVSSQHVYREQYSFG